MWIGVHWQPENVPLIPLSRHQLILREVCRKHGIKAAQLIGPGRAHRYTAARREATVRLRSELGFSTLRIARIMHRDHTTVLYHLLKASVET